MFNPSPPLATTLVSPGSRKSANADPRDRRAARKGTCAKPETAQRGLDVLSTPDTVQVSALPKGFFGPDRYGPFRVDKTRLGALQARALVDGAAVTDHGPVWDVSGKGKWGCSDPLDIALLSAEASPTPVGSSIRLLVRCRKCDSCKRARAAYWKFRAIAEIEATLGRTWFLTLTWRPSSRVRVTYAADLRLRQAGVKEPTPEQLFEARLKTMGPEVTRYLKRIRKGGHDPGDREHPPSFEETVSFRYLLVWEAHTDGFPHAHLLIHERLAGQLLKRRIQRHWWEGFTNCQLVGGDGEVADLHASKAAGYTCKYIAKEMPVRIRASHGYGVNFE